MAAPGPGPNPVLTPSPVVPLPTTTTTTLSTAATVPTIPPSPVPPESEPTIESTRSRRPTNPGQTQQPTNPGGLPPTTSNNPNPDPNNPDGKKNTEEKTNLGPIFGGIAAVLVLAFLTFVFVVRYRKKSKARKRRLDFLGDGNHSTGGLSGAAALGGGGGGGGGGASSISPPRPSGGGRPSTPSGGRPIEMSAVGAGASRLNEGYDYEQGYQQVPFGGYPDQHDQYDPYYAAQHQQPAQGYYPDQQQQGYYPDQQQGYYPPEQQYQNQFMPPAHLGANNNNGYSQGTGSPSMTHVTASPKFPQPPLSSVGGFSAHGTPLQSEVLPEPSYEKFSKLESDSIVTHARNPQLIPENEDRIKVPI